MATLRRASSVLATGVLVLASAVQAGAAYAAPTYPSVVITSPTDASTVSGVVSIGVQGDTDPAGTDATSVLSVFIDGAPFAAYDCAANSAGSSCSHTFTWDSTGLSGSHTIGASLSTVQGGSATASTVTVTVNSPAPVAAVTSPLDGSTVSGVVTINGSGTIDPSQTDSPTSLTFYVDGVALIAKSCAGTVGNVCTASTTWDSTGLSGTHALTVQFATADGLKVTSPATTVTVNSPAPSVAITSPANNSTVSGVVAVGISGSIDPSQVDYIDHINLIVDGNTSTPFYSTNCGGAGTSKTCTASPNWDTTGLTGTHTLRADIYTTKGRVTQSSVVTVTVNSPKPTATVSSPTNGATVSGDVTINFSGSVDSSQVDYVDHISLLIDGALATTTNCNTSQVKTCSSSYVWHVTGYPNGDHTLVARVVTTKSVSVDSATTTVHVTSPAPTATITSPAEGSNVSGLVSIYATGTVDASQVDSVSSMSLYVDGNKVQTATCAGALKSCNQTFTWDGTGKSGAHTFMAEAVTANGKVADSAIRNVTVVSPPPTAAVTSPTDGATVSGDVTINFNGVVDPSQVDYVDHIDLLINGSLQTTYNCKMTQVKTCSSSYLWSATGLDGAYQLQARVVTTNRLTVLSAISTVTVNSPAPTTSITNVHDGDTVAGIVNFDVVGAVDSTQNDSIISLSLYLDGTKIRTAPCNGSGPTKSCETLFTWDGTGISGDHTFASEIVTANGLIVRAPVITVHVISPAPTATITSVADGDTVSGLVNVDILGAVDSTQNDYVDTIRLYVDGMLANSKPCRSAPARTCDTSFGWDVSKLAGDHTLQAQVVTTRAVTAQGALVTVHVSNPNPAVDISSPSTNTIVKGMVTVHADAAVANNVVDYASRITLYVDGNEYTHYTCGPTTPVRLCSIDFTWDTSKTVGAHTLVATLLTNNGVTVTSDPVNVTVFADTALTLAASSSAPRGGTAAFAGQLRTVIGQQPVANAPVTVLVTPAVGNQRIVQMVTDANGKFNASFVTTANTTVSAAFAGNALFGKANATKRVAVRLVLRCTASPQSLRVHQAFKVRCLATGLRSGVQTTLQVVAGRSWRNVVTLTNGASARTFTVKSVARGTLALRVIVPTNRYFVSSTSPVMTVRVR